MQCMGLVAEKPEVVFADFRDVMLDDHCGVYMNDIWINTDMSLKAKKEDAYL